MYIIGLFLYLAFLVGSTLLSGASAAFADFPSIVIILALSLPLLLTSGLMPDLIRGFKIMGQKENAYSALELHKTDIAISLAIKLLLLSGLFGSLFGIISMLSSLSDISLLGKNLSVALLTLLYSVLIIFILLPVRAKVKSIIATLN